MMILDDPQKMSALDSQDMLAHIRSLPQQLTSAWQMAQDYPLPRLAAPRSVLISGMGGSAIGADLVAAYITPLCSVPVIVLRDYDLPAWVDPATTLVVASSHSGNTEETLAVFDQALAKGCSILSITTGGELAKRSQANGIPVWKFVHAGQPRAAVGFSFGLLLAAFTRMGLIPDQSAALQAAVADMLAQQKLLDVDVPVSENPAKRGAGQMMGRNVVVMASGYLAPVSRRWKGQISEVAKAWAQYEVLPEADHNTLAGLSNPADLVTHMMVLFLHAPSDNPRNTLRSKLTREIFMLEAICTDTFHARGDSPLSHIWTSVQYGDYLAYYLAMAYGVDPTPIEFITSLKNAMQG